MLKVTELKSEYYQLDFKFHFCDMPKAKNVTKYKAKTIFEFL